MTTGDEPMLPQPADDNAPMIGRIVQGKIQADLHGAYLAKNLAGLIGYLNEQQRMQFRRAVVRQSHDYMLRFIRYKVGSPAGGVLEEVRLWLESDNPSFERDQTRAIETEPFEGGFINLIVVRFADEVNEPDLARLARRALAGLRLHIMVSQNRASPVRRLVERIFPAARRESDTPDFEQLAEQWQLDAAWAILHDRELPPLPEITV